MIDALKLIMARFGKPKIVFSYNPPEFLSLANSTTYSQKRQVLSTLRVTEKLEKLSKLRKGDIKVSEKQRRFAISIAILQSYTLIQVNIYVKNNI